MTGNSDLRDKGRAVFLAAIMVLSMVAMSATFAGAAAAQNHDIDVSIGDAEGEEGDTVGVSFEIAGAATDEIAGTEVSIDYDQDVVQPVYDGGESLTFAAPDDDEAAFSQGVDIAADPDPSEGTLVFSWLAEGDQGTTTLPITSDEGDGPIEGDDIEFEIVTADEDVSSALDLTIGLDEDEGGDLTVNYDNGQITANAADGEEPPENGDEDDPIEEGDFDREFTFDQLGPRVWQGQQVLVTELDGGETVEVFTADDEGNADDLEFQRSANQDGEVVLNTADLDQDDYVVVRDEGQGATSDVFPIDEHRLRTFDLDRDQVRQDSTATLDVDSNRAGYSLLVTETEQELSPEALATLFDEDDFDGVTVTDDGVVVTFDGTGAEATLSFSEAPIANHTIEATATDTTASASADIEVLEPGDLFVDFAQGSVSEERGDSATFGVEFEGTDRGVVQIEDSGSNYVANLSLEANSDGEALISWNTFEAAQGNADAAFTALEGSIVDVEEELDLTERDTVEPRIIEDDYDLTSYVESVDDFDEVDVDDFDEDNVATIFVNDVDERALAAQSWIAPQGSIDVADDDLEDILDVVNQDDTLADGEFAVVEFDAQGVFGYLTDENDSVNADQGLSLAISEPDQAYDAGDSFTTADEGVDLVPNAADNEMYLIVDTDEVDGLELDTEYDVSFTITDDNDYLEEDELEQVSSTFTVEERSVDVTGVFDDGVLQVPASAETELTAQTNLAPGSEIFMRARARSPAPFLQDTTVEVDDNGVATATFDFSDRDEGVEFTTTARDRVGDVEDQTASVFVADDDEPVPANFGVSNLQPATANVDPGDEVEVSATITNEGDEAGTQDIEFTLDGEVQDSVEEELEPGDSVDVTFAIDAPDVDETTAFEHGVQTEDDSEIGTLTVEVPEPDDDDEPPADDDEPPADDDEPPADDDDDDDEEDDEQPGFGIAVGLLAILGAALLAVRRQN